MSTFRQPMLLLDKSLWETGKTGKSKPIAFARREHVLPHALTAAPPPVLLMQYSPSLLLHRRLHRRPPSKSHRFNVSLPPPRKK